MPSTSRQVPAPLIVRQAVGQEVLEPRPCSGFAGRPGRPQAARPVGLPRQQPPIRQRIRAWSRPGTETSGERERRAGSAEREASPGERRENPKHAACLRPQHPRVEQCRGAEAMKADTLSLQRPRNGGLALPRPRLGGIAGEDRSCPGLPGDGRDLQSCIPPPKNEYGPAPREIARESCEAHVQPPAGRTPRLPGAGRRLVQDVNGDHRATGPRGRLQGGVIAEAQILPEPKHYWLVRFRLGAQSHRVSP